MRKPEWIKEQLVQSGKSQRDLATALEVDPSAISRLLKGERKLRDRELPLLLAFFNTKATDAVAADATGWSDEDQERAEQLLRMMQRKGMDPQRLATEAGVPLERVLGIMDRTGAPLDWSLASRLALALDHSSVAMMTNGDVIERALISARQRRRAMMPGESQNLPFPIFGAPTLNQETGFYDGDFSIVEWREAPAQLAAVERAFGMFIGDASQEPRFLAGEVIYLHPGRPGRPGSYTLAILEDGRIALGRIKSITATKVQLTSGNGREVSFPLADRPRLHRIVGTWHE